jgi:putative ABC transport system ATP-binding protein
MSMLELRQVSKVYGQGAAEVHALREVSLEVDPGTMVAVMGPSGSGKSTLLTIAGSLEEPTTGQVLVAGQDLTVMSRNDKARLRRRCIGYVFQDFNLLPGLTAAENVALPLELDGIRARKARDVGLRALDALGLADRASNYPDQLSGGERQRVAIARAVVGDRHLLLADEPSGALDSANSEAVMRIIHAACRQGVAAVVVTHDAQLAAWADRVVLIRDGRILTRRPAGDQQRQRNAPRYPGGGGVHVPHRFHGRGAAGDDHPGGGGTRPGVHRPAGGGRLLRDGPAQAACPRHAQRGRCNRTQPSPGHDRQRPGRRRGRRAGRGGTRPRRLVRLRAGDAAGHRPRGRRGEPAVVGVHHRGRARDRDVGPRRPAKTIAQVPVVAALSCRPAPPKPVHRSALPGVIVFAGGLACLAVTGGLAGLMGSQGHALLLLGGPVAVIAGLVLLAPLAISVLTAGADPGLPVAIRVAVRDLVRYRARSGAALAATTFAVFLAMGICLAASTKFDNPLNPAGPNLSSSQLIVYAQYQNGGMMTQLSSAQTARLGGQVDSLAARLHGQSVVPLESAGSLYQAGAPLHDNFTGTVYVATPQLLAAYGIKASQIVPGTDILTMRPGLAGLPRMEMTWGSFGGLGAAGRCLGIWRRGVRRGRYLVQRDEVRSAAAATAYLNVGLGYDRQVELGAVGELGEDPPGPLVSGSGPVP